MSISCAGIGRNDGRERHKTWLASSRSDETRAITSCDTQVVEREARGHLRDHSLAALIALVILAAAACGSDLTPQAKVRVSPEDAPSERHLEATKISSIVLPSIPPCQIHQVAARFLGIEGALGHTGVSLGFANTSSTKCSLRGRPAVTLITGSGEALLLRQKGGTYFTDNDDERVVLTPRLPLPTDRTELKSGQALLIFEWMACRPQPRIARIVVSLQRRGRAISIPVTGRGIATSGEPMCGPDR
ncbi:MAG TPA: DUF4232 domain-containing protein, partial [Actinomycetota bacterium]|nr:DUF4232 domain-containing protein [Actinomycetota bacterium]